MIQQLKKERENFDSEKTESREVVKMLETRLKQMTTVNNFCKMQMKKSLRFFCSNEKLIFFFIFRR